MSMSSASKWTALAVVGLALAPALAKNSKPVVPQYMLNARTVAILIDPGAGVSLSDPKANQAARQDVEDALQKWGRFTTVPNPADADLIIVLRRGHAKLVDATVTDPRQNSPIVDVSRSDSGISIGAPNAPPPSHSGPTPNPNAPVFDPQEGGAHPQTEIGNPDDSFLVFEGRRDYNADEIPGWRWVHKNGLHAHDVPAVDEFRKALEDAEKQAAAQQKAKQP